VQQSAPVIVVGIADGHAAIACLACCDGGQALGLVPIVGNHAEGIGANRGIGRRCRRRCDLHHVLGVVDLRGRQAGGAVVVTDYGDGARVSAEFTRDVQRGLGRCGVTARRDDDFDGIPGNIPVDFGGGQPCPADAGAARQHHNDARPSSRRIASCCRQHRYDQPATPTQ
jgi:hypothetical protein